MDLIKKPNQPQKNPSNGWQVVTPKTIAPELKPYSPEWFLSNYLENWSDDDVRVAIENDIRPDLSTCVDLIIDQTTDFFMTFLKTYRPDLKVIQTKQGKSWISEIVKSAMGLTKKSNKNK